MTIEIGSRFDTLYESGCIATSKPDSYGNFTALDSDGIECDFNVKMVTRIY